MPSKEEIDEDYVYAPVSQLEDNRLSLLDKQVYLYLCIIEQLDGGCKSIEEIVKDIKEHPDKNREILNQYLQETGQTIETITDEEWDSLSTVKVKDEDIKASLNKLLELGYIEKEE